MRRLIISWSWPSARACCTSCKLLARAKPPPTRERALLPKRLQLGGTNQCARQKMGRCYAMRPCGRLVKRATLNRSNIAGHVQPGLLQERRSCSCARVVKLKKCNQRQLEAHFRQLRMQNLKRKETQERERQSVKGLEGGGCAMQHHRGPSDEGNS
jgi:hypothetical protein